MPVALRRVLTRTALAAVLLGPAACHGPNQANAAEDPPSVAGADAGDLVAELAGQLSDVAGATYTASYRLAGGVTARIAQTEAPPSTAYVYPGGRIIVTGTAITRCTGAACVVVAPAPATRQPPPESGLITPEAVLGMLHTAELDPQLEVSRRDTTIAGQRASCLRLSGVEEAPAPNFDACVTGEGALGSFTGRVAGRDVEVVLTDLTNDTDPADFTTPPGATVTDRR